MESTKPTADFLPMPAGESDAILETVEQNRRIRDSGAGMDLTTISFLTWKLLLIYDESVEAHERSLRLYSKLLFEALASRSI